MKTLYTIILCCSMTFSLSFSQTITSAASGNWSDGATWGGGTAPTFVNDVVISSGHTLTIDGNTAQCNNLTFGDATAHLAMGTSSSILSVYGNFTLASLAGSGATATATLTGDVVTSIDITAGGSGYVSVVVAVSGGGGSGLTATAILSGGVITSVTINNGGSGYTSAPTINLYPTHSVFSAWPSGAKIKFTGSTAIQTLTGWSPNAFSTSFNEMVVNKASGKVVAGAATNMRFGLGDTLDVIAGTFELGSTDDIEGRTYSGSSSSPAIIVRSGAVFNMIGSTSHIRRGSNTGEETSKIGKMTVYGTAMLAAGSSSKVNLSGIDIENGGIVEMATGRGTSASSYLNPGMITVKNGGTFKNSLSTTNFWFPNTTTPTSVIVNSGGEYEVAASSTTLPSGGITQNSGSSFRFSSGSATTLPATITSYKTLILSGAGAKTLSSSITIDEALQLSGSFTTLGLSTFALTYNANAVLRYGASGQATAQTTKVTEWPASGGPQNVQIYNTGGVTLHDNRTISGILTLTSGTFDNNGPTDDKVLTMGNGATISRAKGALSAAPTFASTINLAYTSSLENVTTNVEIPAASSVLNNLSLTSSQGVTLGGNITVNGILSFGSSAGKITTNANTVTIASTGSVSGEAVGRYVVGNLFTSRSVGTVASTFGGIGFSLASGTDDLGTVSVTRIAGSSGITTVNTNQSIARKWTIASDNPPTGGRDVTFSWVSTDDNSKIFSGTNFAQAWRYNGSTWSAVGSSTDVSASDPRSLTVNTTSFSDWTVSDVNAPLPVEIMEFTARRKSGNIELSWKTATEVNNFGFEIERRSNVVEKMTHDNWIVLGFIEGNGTINTPQEYSFVDRNMDVAQYAYRLKQIDRDGHFSYSPLVEVSAGKFPAQFDLYQNFPNPFNPSTSIKFMIPTGNFVTLNVFDALGRNVSVLVNEWKDVGEYTVRFDGSTISSGLYFYQITAGNYSTVKRMLLIK